MPQPIPPNKLSAVLESRVTPRLILLLAFGLQLSYQVELWGVFPDSFLGQPFCGVDALTHHDRALGLMSGQYPGSEPWLFIPLYPFFLAVIYTQLGTGYYLPVVFQSLLNLTTYAALYAIGRRLFSPTVGALSMAGLVLYAPYTYYLPCFDQALLTLPFFTLAVFFLLRFEARRQWPWLLPAAVALALSALSRPTVLILLPAVILWLFLYRSSLSQFILQALCFGGLVALLIAPITWHNYRATGLFIPLSKNGGVNLFTGNNPDASGLDSLAHAQSQPAVLRHIELQPRRRRGETTYVAEVLAYIREQPEDWLELTATKTRLWFGAADRPLFSPFFPQSIEASPLLSRYPIEWQAAMVTALLGLLLARSRRRSAAVLIWLIYGFFSLATILFFIQVRFRLPFTPIVLLYAMALVAQGSRWLRSRPRRFWLVLTILLIAYLFLPTLWIFILLLAGLAFGPTFQPGGRVAHRWALVAVWSYLVIGGFWAAAQAAQTNVSQTIGHYLGPRLAGGAILGQTFEMDCDNFNQLRIQLGVFSDRHDRPVALSLAADVTAQEILFSEQFDGATVDDHQWRRFSFEPFPDSKGRRYFFFISSPTSTPENSLTARGYTDTPIDFYPAGQAYAGAPGSLQAVEADFAFVAACDRPVFDSLAAGVGRMAGTRQWGFKQPLVYWAILVIHIGLLIAALIYFSRSRPG